MKLERILLELSLAGTGLEGPRQLRLPSRETQQATVDSCTHVEGSLEPGGVFILRAVIGVKPQKTPQFTVRQELVILPMSRQQRRVKLSSVRNKRFDPGG